MPDTFSAPAIAIIPAAGIGQRMGSDIPKQYLDCAGKPLIWHTLNRFQQCPWIDSIYVPLAENDPYWTVQIGNQFSKVITLIGGASRAESVLNGIEMALKTRPETSWALVHDAARPCLSSTDLEMLRKQLIKGAPDGLILADKIHDTVKLANASGEISQTVDRQLLWRAQTPQVFTLGQLHLALRASALEDITDEASSIEAMGKSPLLVQGSPTNIKVTTPDDLRLAELFLTSGDTA